MSVLKIFKLGEIELRQETKEVSKITSKIQKLISDMIDTMYANDGVGLAAPQVGVNYKIYVIDITENNEPNNPLIFINPKIIKSSGETVGNEGCLSIPRVYTEVNRYSNVTVKAKNRDGKDFILSAEDGSLLSRAIQHENDHLNGILFVDKAIDIEDTNNQLKQQGLPFIEEKYLILKK